MRQLAGSTPPGPQAISLHLSKSAPKLVMLFTDALVSREVSMSLGPSVTLEIASDLRDTLSSIQSPFKRSPSCEKSQYISPETRKRHTVRSQVNQTVP